MFSESLISTLKKIETPFYFYDTGLLRKTLFATKDAADLFNFHLHYAIKANANERILQIISQHGLGADCVSANEIETAIKNGFEPNNIVFAGVGKTDKEIEYAIQNSIFSINCESVQELDVINEIAKSNDKKVRVALRINPNVNANTHKNITTGLKSNKFGISFSDLTQIIENIDNYTHLLIDGLHFHIGSQITDLMVFVHLCSVVNKIYEYVTSKNIHIGHINLGGGLGINYTMPENQIPDFLTYFRVFYDNLNIPDNVKIHFEHGRSIVGQSGSLITKALYVKENEERKTVIVDAGLTELIRPALYEASHKIINLSSKDELQKYDIAGPICETSDYFGKDIRLPATKRGDLIALLSTGAYGEVMSSQYNLRTPAAKYFSDKLFIKLEI
jgi:diaminopimelate decarboxylase